jgi:hypothetical protein
LLVACIKVARNSFDDRFFSGPFLDDDRQQIEDDYFAFEGHDVTDQGLGEAARRCYFNLEAGCFSFVGGPVDCERNPLTVQHGLDDQPLGYVDVPNVYEIEGLEKSALAALPIPTSWAELLEQCRLRFDRLVFSDGILKQLRGQPFSSYVCERVFALLSVLQQYMDQRLPNGERSLVCHQIVTTHFTGDKAWFTDESDQNKRKFRNEMTFSDPENGTRQLFCPWHGKIKSPQYRIHFDWPAAPEANHIKVLYIGPKITKD